MSITDRFNELTRQSEETKSLTEYLLEQDSLTHPVSIGVAKQIVDKGLSSLSDKQYKVFEEHIKPLIDEVMEPCPVCGDYPRSKEDAEILEFEGCHCQHRMMKD